MRPPPPKPDEAPIEAVLQLTQLSDISPDLFTNTRQLWHPPGARGIYGGAVIAQCLAAAQKTVPLDFAVHSMHCYFVLAGSSDMPVIYHVERVRGGKSFATRTVQARQRGNVIFTVTMSFTREGSGGKQQVRHSVPMADIPAPVDEVEPILNELGKSPFQNQRIGIHEGNSSDQHRMRPRQWIKARGRISEAGGHQAHLSALAYMSDSYFIGTVARVHKLRRLKLPDKDKDGKEQKGYLDAAVVAKLRSMDAATLGRMQGMDDDLVAQIKGIGKGDADSRPELGMMVSLDHTIYFHEPRAFSADEWLFSEMETPWAGDGRGLVLQRIYTKDGLLIATCMQEVCIVKRVRGECNEHADLNRVLSDFSKNRRPSCN